MPADPASLPPAPPGKSWLLLGERSTWPDDESVRVFEVDGKAIAVWRVGERFVAMVDLCPHEAVPLSEGWIAGDVVVCPRHGWQVCLDDGTVRRGMPGSRVPTFHVEVTPSGQVLLAV